MKRVATALLMLVVAASIAPATATAGITSETARQASGQAYAGTHVSFDAAERAVTDYAVDGETMLNSVKVQSAGETESGGLVDVGASLSAVTQIEGAGLSLGATTETEARVAVGAESNASATITAHDNGNGVLVVAAGNQSDYVVANLSADANASAESDSQVEVTTANGTEGTFLVVGEGNVTVNDQGDVSANLGSDGRLVFRAYPDGKDDADEKQESLITEGEAKAEAHVMVENASDGANETGQVVVDTVSYGQNTTVEAAETAEGKVTLAVNRTTHEGTVLVTSVSEKALNATGDLTVTVDGEAAVEAGTYTQLKSAIGSDQSRYMVESAGSAEASADVLVAVNHFSERTVSMQSADADETTTSGTTDGGETTTGDTADEETSTSDDANGETTDEAMADETATTTVADETTDNGAGLPGFTATAAVVALVGAALLARTRSR